MIEPFKETVVFYPEDTPVESGFRWVAHGLRTDQIGLGHTKEIALSDFRAGVAAIIRVAEKDATVAYLREAPEAIQLLDTHADVVVVRFP